MQLTVALVLVALAAIGFVLWLLTTMLLGILQTLQSLAEAVQGWWRKRAVLAAKKAREKHLDRLRKEQEAVEIAKATARKLEEEQDSSFRRANPVKLLGIPDLRSLEKLVTLLDGYIAEANAYDPKFVPTHDTKFRDTQFSFPHDFFFPRQFSDSADGPEPAPWEMTLDNALISRGREMRGIYGSLASISDFPCTQPMLPFDPPPAPTLLKLPSISLRGAKVVSSIDGTEIDPRVAALRRIFKSEFDKVELLNHDAVRLQEEFVAKKDAAIEAAELMNIRLAHQMLIYKEAAREVSEAFKNSRHAYQQECERQIGPIKRVYEEYRNRTKSGIEGHFNWALRTLALPLPRGFPWQVFFDLNERILQVNQRVPFLTDIIVKRSDSRRPPTKRASDSFLRRIVPAISLHLAQHVAINDVSDDVGTIAVNCWCRYFEKTSGKLTNAFVSSLKVEKEQVADLNINKADALEAFRALRGVFVYSVEEIAPIEPQIRLDKRDSRFVEGKEVLDGMAQGQNLATMDWQDFEHLIRELLAKEFGGREGSEVRITRASRDRGVDAVIFDPDPLHGGKYVVQAKRYNNTVDVSAVRDLWGTVLNEGAARGILVTTSKYGRDAYDFSSNKPITLIDGQNLLSLLAKHGYRFKIQSL